MSAQHVSRRDFLRLAALSGLGLALPRRLTLPGACPAVGEQVLSAAQRWRLQRAAQTFIAPELASARQMAIDVDFIEGPNEDASTMCGPLTIAILQEAGLLGAWASRHEFWLLNPRVNLQPVEDTFPETLYAWHQFEQPIAEFDFAEFPLMAGDMLYLHAGSGDTFEHMLVVTRVDEEGKAYTVSNFFIATGTIIEERLLYDPATGAGQIADWADRSIRNTRGNTGGGGFRLWRVKDAKTLEFPNDAASKQLRAELDALLLSAAGNWSGAIQQVSGPLLYQFDPYAAFHPASTIKVPIALAFYRWLEGQDVGSDWQEFLKEHGVKNRSYAQLLRSMIVLSEEEATEILVDFLGKAYLAETWEAWGLDATQADPRRSSATDLLACLGQALSGDWIADDYRGQLLELMGTYTSNDATRLGRLLPGLPDGSAVYNKRGSLVEWPTVVSDSGIILLGGVDAPAYLFTLHGVGKNEAGYDDLEPTLDQAIDLFGDFLSQQTS